MQFSKNPTPLDYYQSNNYRALAACNIIEPVDLDRNTVLHYIAKNADKECIDLLIKYNPKIMSYEIVNRQNIHQETPLHFALKCTKDITTINNFINLLIDLGANTDIPDINFNILIKKKKKPNILLYNMNNKIETMNRLILNNIEELTKIIDSDKKIDIITQKIIEPNDKIKMISQSPQHIVGNKSIENIDFIKDITNYYMSNTLRSEKNKDEISSLMNAKKHNPTESIYNNRNYLKNARKVNKEFLNGNEYDELHKQLKIKKEKIQNQRLFGGDSILLRKKEKSIHEQLQQLERNYKNMLGGKHKNKIDTESSPTTEYASNSSPISSSTPISYMMRTNKRNTEADDMFKSFIEKIIDQLDVDEKTARIYRFAIKKKVIEKNPDLRKRANDMLKMEEMAKIINNKKKLKEITSDIDIKAIQKIMDEIENQRKKHQEERRKEKTTDREKTTEREKTKRESKKSKQETSDSVVSSDVTMKTPKNIKKESGYLNSDEVIISSEY